MPGHVGLGSGKSFEDEVDLLLGQDNGVLVFGSLQVDQVGCRIRGDVARFLDWQCVAVDKLGEDVGTLWSDLVDTLVLELSLCGIGCALEEAGVHEGLTQVLGHVAGERELGGDDVGDDPCGVLWVSVAVGLDELEAAEVGNGFLGGETVGIVPEQDFVVLDWQGDHQSREKVKNALFFIQERGEKTLRRRISE